MRFKKAKKFGQKAREPPKHSQQPLPTEETGRGGKTTKKACRLRKGEGWNNNLPKIIYVNEGAGDGGGRNPRGREPLIRGGVRKTKIRQMPFAGGDEENLEGIRLETEAGETEKRERGKLPHPKELRGTQRGQKRVSKHCLHGKEAVPKA